MRSLVLLVSAALLATVSNAQSKFYAVPIAGIGYSDAHQDFFHANWNGGDLNKKKSGNYNLQILVGYQWRHWSIETGLQYLETGYKYPDLTFGGSYPVIIYGSAKLSNSHLNIPLHFGYVINTKSKFSIVPTLGVDVGFNLDERSYNVIGDDKHSVKTPSEDFKKTYNTVSVWGNAGVRVEYKLSQRFAVVAGPQFQYMISNFLNVPADAAYHASQRNYSLDFNAGVKVNL
jgi:hypothetical protein